MIETKQRIEIEPKLQGQGIGGMVMQTALRRADAVGELAYVETDTTRNVEFYRRHGFEVAATEEVLGVQMWYLER
jgi:ribosomal protein S18 acetylase RimI-like enzyme